MKFFWMLMALIGSAAVVVLWAPALLGDRTTDSAPVSSDVPGLGAGADRATSWQPSVPPAEPALRTEPAPRTEPASAAVPPERPSESAPLPDDEADDAPAPAESAQDSGRTAAAEAPSESAPAMAGVPPLLAPGGGSAPPMGLTPAGGHVHQAPLVLPDEHADVGRDLDALLGLEPEAPEDAEAHAERIAAAHRQAIAELEERYGILGGEGTRERPFRIDWERLAAASRVYRPREGLVDVPPFIQRLDGAFVELAGYTLFSWSGLQIDEILLTRYMWDGCCIGVPPTPFTAVETRLREPMERRDVWAMRSGIFVGRFSVDPYVQGEWLIALYVLEDAELQPVF